METLKEMLKRHEGWKMVPYQCPAHHWTVGAGHDMDATPLPEDMADSLKKTGKITEEMAERLLDQDIGVAETACRRLYRNFGDMSETRKNAFIDFVFDVGEGTARRFIMAKAAIEKENWDEAARCMRNSTWYGQVGDRGQEIVEMVRTG